MAVGYGSILDAADREMKKKNPASGASAEATSTPSFASGTTVNTPFGSLSEADAYYAAKNPQFGAGIQGAKTGFANAQSDEERAMYNAQANALRMDVGNYSGGTDGSSYIWGGPTKQARKDTLSQIGSYPQFSYTDAPKYAGFGPAPTYTSKYGDRIDASLNAISDRPEFEYDYQTDPNYQAYAKQYRREGRRAQQNALADAAMRSGGRVSSWAQTAASQQGDYYASQLSDKIPELYQQAYNRYLSEFNNELAKFGALSQAEQLEFTKYLEQLAQYNTDRNFDYNKYLTELGQYNTDRNFAYNQYNDDYSRLNNYYGLLGDRDNTQYARANDAYARVLDQRDRERQIAEQAEALKWSQADALAGIGDYSGYESLGADTSYARSLQELEMQNKAATLASKSKSGSSSGSKKKTEDDEEESKDVLEQMRDAGVPENGAYTWLIQNGFKHNEAKGIGEYYPEWLEANPAPARASGLSDDEIRRMALGGADPAQIVSRAASISGNGQTAGKAAAFDPDGYSADSAILYNPGSASQAKVYSAADQEYNGAVKWMRSNGQSDRANDLFTYAEWLDARESDKRYPETYPDYLKWYVGA